MTRPISLAVGSHYRSVVQLAVFGSVGVVAAVVHFSVVSALVPFGARPLAANVAGFLAAVSISFAGHDRWSFPSRARARRRAMRRFLTVAVMGFVCNEALYWALLELAPLSYRVALLIVLAAVATLTFLMSKHWAFRDD